MTFQPVLPWPILAVVAGALAFARAVALRQVLVSAGRRRIPAVLRWGGVTLAVLLVIAASTRPALRHTENRGGAPAGANLNVFMIVDRSADSAVDDYGAGKTRLGGMRDDMSAVINRYPAARYALITFASKATLNWPLSQDVWSLRPSVAALASDQSGRANTAAAGTVVRYQLMQAAQQYPGSRNVVLYFGSGAPGESEAQGPDFDLTQASVTGGAVLGYGRSDAIDEVELSRIAAQFDVPYLLRHPGQALRLTLPDTRRGPETQQRIELYWLPALLTAALLLAEIYLFVREFRRGRIARRGLVS
ncbi:vWA domain-containing protein [Mycobacterium sherrisii]|uniref:VWFA domain-containing protein n=1 Tax=Mycobacterium sherrisii TaxID=243061 RepID=A0A1E3SY58_9MYCO|nr:vWA domain-containing protein [Mycobacterium sherrisii]MEC4763445.1 vWA domain-containing protein [Mycobacterium sherrisii]ODR07061.1 hypothetical protein BHQ21_10045 [Mycobacterium sherrisii]